MGIRLLSVILSSTQSVLAVVGTAWTAGVICSKSDTDSRNYTCETLPSCCEGYQGGGTNEAMVKCLKAPGLLYDSADVKCVQGSVSPLLTPAIEELRASSRHSAEGLATPARRASAITPPPTPKWTSGKEGQSDDSQEGKDGQSEDSQEAKEQESGDSQVGNEQESGDSREGMEASTGTESTPPALPYQINSEEGMPCTNGWRDIVNKSECDEAMLVLGMSAYESGEASWAKDVSGCLHLHGDKMVFNTHPVGGPYGYKVCAQASTPQSISISNATTPQQIFVSNGSSTENGFYLLAAYLHNDRYCWYKTDAPERWLYFSLQDGKWYINYAKEDGSGLYFVMSNAFLPVGLPWINSVMVSEACRAGGICSSVAVLESIQNSHSQCEIFCSDAKWMSFNSDSRECHCFNGDCVNLEVDPFCVTCYVGKGAVIRMGITILGLDYDLMSDQGFAPSFRQTVIAVIRQEISSVFGIDIADKTDVNVQLAKGSVVASVTIASALGEHSAIRQHLATSLSLGTNLGNQLEAISSIQDVATGPIQVTAVVVHDYYNLMAPPTPMPTTFYYYLGCFVNFGNDRIEEHESSKTIHECATLAMSSGQLYFGMEHPTGNTEAGHAECLVLSSFPSMTSASDTECEIELFNSYRLGGSYFLAAYSTQTSACPWLHGPTSIDHQVQCGDGSFCNVLENGWSCCASKGNRIRCPPNFPDMCAAKICGAGGQYCCDASGNDCLNYGGLRTCQAAVPQYHIRTSGICTVQMTESECGLVAADMGAHGGIVNPTKCTAADCAPNGCYQYTPNQKVHHSTGKIAECTSTRRCFCKGSVASNANVANVANVANGNSRMSSDSQVLFMILIVLIVAVGVLICVVVGLLVVCSTRRRFSQRMRTSAADAVSKISVVPQEVDSSINLGTASRSTAWTETGSRPPQAYGKNSGYARGASAEGEFSNDRTSSIPTLSRGKRYHYFLSHKKTHSRLSKQPEALALSLHDSLCDRGFTGFFDVDSLKTITQDELKQNVKDSAVMIVCLHDETFQSEWCRLEWRVAEEEDIPIICVVDQDNFVKSDVLAACSSAGCGNLMEHQWISYIAAHRKQAILEVVQWLEKPDPQLVTHAPCQVSWMSASPTQKSCHTTTVINTKTKDSSWMAAEASKSMQTAASKSICAASTCSATEAEGSESNAEDRAIEGNTLSVTDIESETSLV